MKKSMMKTLVIAASLLVGLTFGQGAFAAGTGPGGQVIGEGGNPGAWTLDMPVADLEGFKGTEPIDTFTGTVTSVGKMKGVKDGVQLALKSGSSTYTVLLGPGWFINNQSLKFAAKDKIEVRGKRVGFNIVASEVSKGDWTMRLRNEADGAPEWQCCFLREKKM